ncbi:MAG: methylated-DNA--[protein]-cysteine S-methyltransferase [Rhodocyclaceae bacterium]|nr:MAG: methylated-DNA--[protein]-cysteine S-methyltransferase [Rhodocyclaceae bacterium]
MVLATLHSTQTDVCPGEPVKKDIPPFAATTQAARDFERIARVLDILSLHWREQPSLAWVAAEAGLSEFHLQRLFSHWVGVSPKRFVQYITKEAARSYLADAASLLDAALACGLSGSARLHDLFVRYEGMTPGDFKASLRGRPMTWGEVATPFGSALAVFAPRGLHRLEFFADAAERDCLLGEWRKTYPQAQWQAAEQAQLRLLAQAFLPDRSPAAASNVSSGDKHEGSTLALCVTGSDFQLKVWEALMAIPQGKTVSYGGLAQAIGHPGAARAVGNAVAANTVAWLIPCHRVIRETGMLGHYRWRPERKRAMLGWEQAGLPRPPEGGG